MSCLVPIKHLAYCTMLKEDVRTKKCFECDHFDGKVSDEDDEWYISCNFVNDETDSEELIDLNWEKFVRDNS